LTRSRRARLLAIATALVALVAVVVAVVAIRRQDTDDVARAVSIARTTDGYDSGIEAGRTLARTASALNEAIRSCDRTEEPDRCAALGAASGYVQVVAAEVVHCTAPGRIESRQSVLDVLDALRDRGPGDPPPKTPPLPDCRA
jgi:hypothetical protein